MTRTDFFPRSQGIKIHQTFQVGEFKWNTYHVQYLVLYHIGTVLPFVEIR